MFQFITTVFLGFFAMVNPIANTAAFVSLTKSKTHKEQVHIATKALILSFVIVFSFAILGNTILTSLGITLPAVRIVGGILLFFIGFQMLHGVGSDINESHGAQNKDVAVSPLAIPLLAGPGTIAATINYSSTQIQYAEIITILVFLIICLITFFAFIFGNRLLDKLGNSFISIITRLMGLILAIIGTQMVINGIYGAVRAFT